MTAALLLPFDGVWPEVADDAFLAPGAVLVGNVKVGAASSVWFGAVLRGDHPTHAIVIGPRTSVQDGCVIHVGDWCPTTVGSDCTIGHGAKFESCTIGDRCTVGMNAVILQEAAIGDNSLVAAGSVVLERTDVPPGSLVAGVPARIRKTLDERGEVRDGASDALRSARSKIRSLRTEIRRTLERVMSNHSSAIQETLIVQRRERYVVPAKTNFRRSFEGVIQDRSAGGETLFVEPMTAGPLNNALADALETEREEVNKILRELSAAAMDGREALAARVQPENFYTMWSMEWQPPSTLDPFGFAGIRFAIHTAEATAPTPSALALFIGDLSVELLRAPFDVVVGDPEWQVVEVSFEHFVITNYYSRSPIRPSCRNVSCIRKGRCSFIYSLNSNPSLSGINVNYPCALSIFTHNPRSCRVPFKIQSLWVYSQLICIKCSRIIN